MLKAERHNFILHQLNLHNKILSADLSMQIDVSDDTIRRDLQQLSEKGKIVKVHGGAMSLSFHNGNHTSKEVYAYSQKKIIAQKAASLIKDGMFVLTGGGTTIIELARALPPSLKATFISGSIPVLFEYTNHPNIEVIAIGDKISKNSKISVGAEAMSKVSELKVDICFLGINAINLENGVSDNEWDIVQIKKAMIASSRKTICLTISEKINSRQSLQICDCSKIDTLITELSPENPVMQPYVKKGITVL
ncbi:MAG: DeoR/GlpR family DNA-binding transcription regulator [Ginsengibacter sp.]